MSPWTKSMALVAVTLCCSMTFATTNARAEETEEADETAESTNNIVVPSNDDATHRVDLIDPWEHRRGHRSCLSYCDDLQARCLRGYIGRWEHRDDRHHGNDVYRRCEQRFDFCVAVCRGPVLYGSSNGR